MEYVPIIISVIVFAGIIAVITSGSKLSNTVKSLSSVVMLLIVLNPVCELITKWDIRDYMDSIDGSNGLSEQNAEELYIKECKKLLEEKLSENLEYKYKDLSFTVEIELDATDPSAVLISSVRIYTDKEVGKKRSQITETVIELTGCSDIDFELRREAIG